MPHFTDFGGARLAAQPEKESFHTPFGTARSKESFGTFNALNETTNFRPAKGESVSIVHPTFRTGLINPDSMRPIDELTSSFIEKAELMRHAPKDSEYRPQSSIDVVTGKPDSSSIARVIGLQITGEGPDQWIQYDTNDGAVEGKLGPDSMLPIDELTSSFIEKADLMRHAPKDSEYRPQSSIDVVTGKPDSTSAATEIGLQITGEGPDQWIQYNTNDGAVEGKLGGKSDSGGTSFITSAIEAPAEMTSFGESLNLVLELGGDSGPGASTYLTGQFEMPTDNVGNPYSAPID